MPYPNIDSGLAMSAHMYICKKGGINKELLKIQTVKNKHKIDGFPIANYHTLDAIDSKNPCKRDSFVDLEKNFQLNNVEIPLNLTTTPGVDDLHFNQIVSKIGEHEIIDIDIPSFLSVNTKCKNVQTT